MDITANIAANDWIALMCLVFTLGMRHGLDADHLVAIDGLTRFNAPNNPGLARRCGALFSLGHGFVVVAVALLVGALTERFTPPHWLQDLGAWVSIGFLLALGVLNILAVVRTQRDEPVRLIGLKACFFTRIQRVADPFFIALVGSVFALSFDTLSQAALFAVTATQFGGTMHALALGALFTLGMLVVDGCNGLWMYRLINRANERALIASRAFAFVISSLSLAVAAFGIAKYCSPDISHWSEHKELAIGVAVVAFVMLGFLLAMGVSRIKTAST
jgi:high-affinity nickel-transport protein